MVGVQPCGRMPLDESLNMYTSVRDVLDICVDGVVR